MAENKIGYKYNGTIAQFKASDYPTTHADKVVYIMGDSNGVGKGMFVQGNYLNGGIPMVSSEADLETLDVPNGAIACVSVAEVQEVLTFNEALGKTIKKATGKEVTSLATTDEVNFSIGNLVYLYFAGQVIDGVFHADYIHKREVGGTVRGLFAYGEWNTQVVEVPIEATIKSKSDALTDEMIANAVDTYFELSVETQTASISHFMKSNDIWSSIMVDANSAGVVAMLMEGDGIMMDYVTVLNNAGFSDSTQGSVSLENYYATSQSNNPTRLFFISTEGDTYVHRVVSPSIDVTYGLISFDIPISEYKSYRYILNLSETTDVTNISYSKTIINSDTSTFMQLGSNTTDQVVSLDADTITLNATENTVNIDGTTGVNITTNYDGDINIKTGSVGDVNIGTTEGDITIDASGALNIKADTDDKGISIGTDIEVNANNGNVALNGASVLVNGEDITTIPVYRLTITPTIATTPTSGYQYSVTACSIDSDTAENVYNKLVECANNSIPIYVNYSGSNAWRWFMGSCTIPASGQVLLEYWLPSGSHFQIIFTASGFRNGTCWNIRQGLQSVMDSGSSSGGMEVVIDPDTSSAIELEIGKSYQITSARDYLECVFPKPTDLSVENRIRIAFINDSMQSTELDFSGANITWEDGRGDIYTPNSEAGNYTYVTLDCVWFGGLSLGRWLISLTEHFS